MQNLNLGLGFNAQVLAIVFNGYVGIFAVCGTVLAAVKFINFNLPKIT